MLENKYIIYINPNPQQQSLPTLRRGNSIMLTIDHIFASAFFHNNSLPAKYYLWPNHRRTTPCYLSPLKWALLPKAKAGEQWHELGETSAGYLKRTVATRTSQMNISQIQDPHIEEKESKESHELVAQVLMAYSMEFGDWSSNI
ncbi:hypothetical protein BDC45DRAFT_568706 [Circinella umbellata]|nr:hypothetical protein BDC45DRAFT_568706 [Circinella umbellata]